MVEEELECKKCPMQGAPICVKCYSNPFGPNYLGKFREEEQRWTAGREAEQAVQYRQVAQQAYREIQLNQTLEMKAMPSPFVMPFQNGL